MGVFDEKQDDIIIIRDEKNWEPHEQCCARTVVKVADFEWVQNQLVLIKQTANKSRRGAFQRDAQMDIQAQTGAADRLWVFRMLVDWTFTKGGQPMPLSLEAVKQLPQHVLNFIYNKIQEAQPKEDGEEDAESRTVDDGQEDVGDPFFSDALLSTAGVMSKDDQEQSNETGQRNFLLKS